MKIMLINQYAGSPSLGMEYRPHWMATEMISQGHQVLIVTANESHLRTRILPTGDQQIEGVPFKVFWTPKYSRNGFKRFLNILIFRYQLYANGKMLLRWGPDIVMASSTHPMDLRPSARIAKKAGAKFVFEIHDLWPLTPILIAGFSKRHPMIRWMFREESFGYKNADLAASLLPETKEYMVSRGLNDKKWIWIPNGVGRFQDKKSPPSLHVKSINSLKTTFSKIMVYAGTIGPANKVDTILDIAQEASDLGIGIVIVGGGPLKEELVGASLQFENIIFLPHISREELLGLFEYCDFAYAGAAPSPLYDFGISFNKIFDYMSSGLPILLNVETPSSPVHESNCGWIVSPKIHESLIHQLTLIAALNPDELREIGKRGTMHLMNSYRIDTLTGQLLARLEQV